MNKNKIISIIVLIFGIVLIGIGVFTSLNSSNEEKPDNNSNTNINNDITNNDIINNEDVSDDEDIFDIEESLNYDSVYDMALSLYGGDGKVIEVEETDTEFVIYVKNTDGKIISILGMDKKTEIISEKEVISSSASAG